MKKNIYYFVDELPSDGLKELKEFMYLLEASSYDEIYDKHFKLGLNNKKDSSSFWYGTTLEVFLFNKFLKDKEDINFHILFTPELFIVNDELFIIDENQVKKIEIENSYFYTLRTDFNHPFHEILDILCQKKGGHINKPTFRPIDTTYGERNKFTGIVGLYKNFFKYLDTIIIPYGVTEKNYGLLLDWIGINIGNKLVLKKDCYQCGYGLSMIDLLNKPLEENISKVTDILSYQRSILYRPYFVKFYEFKDEYRVYFIKTKDEITIYSIKHKKLAISSEALFDTTLFKDSAQYTWSYIPKSEWKDHEHIIQASKNMISSMLFQTGTLEFGETHDNKIIYFEVNPMGSPMIFDGDDVADIHKFYMDLFTLLTKKDIGKNDFF